MTPHELGRSLSAQLGAPVRLWPRADAMPWVWTTTGLRDHAQRDGEAVERARVWAVAQAGVVEYDGVLTLTAGADQVAAILGAPRHDAAVAQLVEDAAGLGDDGAVAQLLAQQRASDDALRLTRDDARITYGELVARVGDASARWARARSADGVRLDVPFDRLGTRTLDDPLFGVLLAHARLGRCLGPADRAGPLIVQLAQVPMAGDEVERTRRTRPWALHLEAVAQEALRWIGLPHSHPVATWRDPRAPVTWTSAQVAHAARIVLASGLQRAEIPAPAQI